MKLKTTTATTNATDACQEALIRGGFATMINTSFVEMRSRENKPGEVIYRAWFPYNGPHRDWSVVIHKGTVVTPFSKTNYGWVGWGHSNPITLILA